MKINVTFYYTVVGSIEIDTNDIDTNDVHQSIKDMVRSNVDFENEYIDEVTLDYISYDDDDDDEDED